MKLFPEKMGRANISIVAWIFGLTTFLPIFLLIVSPHPTLPVPREKQRFHFSHPDGGIGAKGTGKQVRIIRLDVKSFEEIVKNHKAQVFPLHNSVSTNGISKLMTFQTSGYYTVILYLLSSRLSTDEFLFLELHPSGENPASPSVQLLFSHNSTLQCPEIRTIWTNYYLSSESSLYLRHYSTVKPRDISQISMMGVAVIRPNTQKM